MAKFDMAKFLQRHLRQFGKRARSTLDPPGSATPRRFETTGIELKNVSIAYGDRLAVAGVTGRFAPGSLTAVVGPNGVSGEPGQIDVSLA